MVARTKSKIACFAGPSFHDGSNPPGVCAGAETGRSGADNAGSSANVESRTRRLIPEGFMFDSEAAGQLLDGGFLSFSMACSTEKLPGFCWGGNCLKLSRCCATSDCAGTSTKAWSTNHRT